MRNSVLIVAVVAMATFAIGCAITDYDGITGHKTTAEAKIWGLGVAFTGFGDDLDGTYDYTVKYDNQPGVGSGKVKIHSYRIPNMVSFNRDGLVDRDGDDVQGNSGDAGGKWTQWVDAIDTVPGSCQFDDNFGPKESRMWDSGMIGIAYCINGFEEEIDQDWDLNASFTSLDDLLGQIWSGALQGNFTLDLTSIRLDGVTYDLLTPVSVGATVTPNRPARFTISNGPGIQELITVILNNTVHGAPVSFGFGFDGGLSLDAPARTRVAFNHDALLGV